MGRSPEERNNIDVATEVREQLGQLRRERTDGFGRLIDSLLSNEAVTANLHPNYGPEPRSEEDIAVINKLLGILTRGINLSLATPFTEMKSKFQNERFRGRFSYFTDPDDEDAYHSYIVKTFLPNVITQFWYPRSEEQASIISVAYSPRLYQQDIR